jgi:hypothetical protein
MSTTGLTTYVNDHLAASVAALEMLDRLIEHPVEPDDARFFTALRDELRREQDELRRTLERLDASESTVRQAAGWLAEKAGALKLRWDDPSAIGLRRFQSLETLAVGIFAKLSMWRAMAAVADGIPALQPLDLSGLARQAERQHAEVERRRVAAAAMVFV